MLQDRPELFMKDNTVRPKLWNLNIRFSPNLRQCSKVVLIFLQVRPGILVLVNDSDWELLGELEYIVQASFCQS